MNQIAQAGAEGYTSLTTCLAFENDHGWQSRYLAVRGDGVVLLLGVAEFVGEGMGEVD
jgi:hypothetical protein